MSVKIAALEAENVKRIKAVALTPSPTGLTIVGGNNNQGKTSVLDALAWALGGEKFRPTAAVRDGALAPPHLKVILSNGVVVERRGKNSSLTVTDPTGQRTARMDLLNGADLPLTGLGVEDGSLTYNGKHWQDMSGSDQLRVATAIVRRLNPDCGFVLLDKLEQIDLATLAEFGSWLQAEGLQAIATRVSTGGECQIIIEDGRVKDAEEPPAPKAWTKGAF